ncbi:MAG: hypothetical protein KAS48_03975 [Gammaproteobacteria bacterium]|nr:hypothetical protein [Gammaproteobacteria bacterium]
MSRILFAWELGTGYGHIARFLPVAIELREAGHEVIFALKDLLYAEEILGPHGFTFQQAPVWQHQPHDLPEPASFAEILFKFGYLNPVNLLAMVKAWNQLYMAVKPDLLIIDYGPTALIASKDLGIPRAMIGTGFLIPPRETPIPGIQPWKNIPAQRLVNSEARVLQAINDVLSRLGQPALEVLAELFDVDEKFLTTFRELDHYQDRTEAHYWGPQFSADEGVSCSWPPGNSKKIFAYLKPTCKHFTEIIRQLALSPYRSLIHAPGLSDKKIEQLQSDNIIFSINPVNIREASEVADMAICHAGFGTVSAMLLGGCHVLLLPLQLEQAITANNIEKLGAAIVIYGNEEKPDFSNIITELATRPELHKKAADFSVKHRDYDKNRQIDKMVARCNELITNNKL